MDLISRQAAIDALGTHDPVSDSWTDEYELGTYKQWEQDRKAISEVPSAEPVRKGTWATDSYGAMDDGEYLVTRCSVCGTAYEYGHDDRYCGFCGAEMEGEEDV